MFAHYLRRIREAVFAERRTSVARLSHDIVVLHRESGAGLDEVRKGAANAVLRELESRFGYEESSAVDAAAALLRERFHQILP